MWAVYVFLFTFVLMPVGSVAWWVDPLWFGPLWGRVVAVFVTGATVVVIHSWFTERKKRA